MLDLVGVRPWGALLGGKALLTIGKRPKSADAGPVLIKPVTASIQYSEGDTKVSEEFYMN